MVKAPIHSNNDESFASKDARLSFVLKHGFIFQKPGFWFPHLSFSADPIIPLSKTFMAP